MIMTLRLDAATASHVARLARRRRMTRSALIREAIAMLDRDGPGNAGPRESMYEGMKRLGVIGCIRGGPPDLSVNTGEKVRRILEEKRKRWSL